MDSAKTRIPYERCPLCDEIEAVEEMRVDCTSHPLHRPELPRIQRWMRCGRCDHVYVDGYFSPDDAAMLLSSSVGNQTPGDDAERARFMAGQVVELVCDRLPGADGRWLDVGFGNGGLMTTAEEFGFQVVGLDLRQESVRLMREFGFEAHAKEFDKFGPAEPFDVISMADVLEHMVFPKEALRHARAILREGGLLFASMPNSDSLVWSLLTRQNANPYWAEIEHYHNFGRKRFYALLAECGFEPIHYRVSPRYRVGMEVLARTAPPLDE